MEHQRRYRAAKRATLVNASTNLFLAFLKIILGIFGHSHALVADGVHSLSDLFTDAVVLFAAKMGTEQPDSEHPYGHRRIETIATLIVAIVLLTTAIGIGYDTLSHILSGKMTEKPAFLVVIIAVISILLNEFLYHYTLYEGNKSDSELLRSNAWHNRSDALISMVVLVSVIGSLLGASYLDAIGALIIALLIFKVSLKMMWQGARELIDTGADRELIEKIQRLITQTPGVNALHQLRTRAHGHNILLDVHIEVDPIISISEAHYISEQVSLTLIKEVDRVTDVVVHVDPEDDQRFMLSKDLPDRPTVEAMLYEKWKTLTQKTQIKRLQLHYLNGKITVDLYLPLSQNSNTLYDAFWASIKDISYLQGLNLYYE